MLLLCLSSQAVQETESRLFVMSALHRANAQNSSVNRWEIDSSLKEAVDHNMNGEIIVAAAIQCSSSKCRQWNSGVGSLLFNVNGHQVLKEEASIRCVYMSVSGADGKLRVSFTLLAHVLDASYEQ